MIKRPFTPGENWHVDQGRRAKFVGQGFEDWIDVQHDKAIRLGILAHVTHNQAKTDIKKGRLIYMGKGVADYSGVLDRCGRAFAAEAKSTKGDRLARAEIKSKQAEHLSAVAHAGGLALLLVEFRHEVPSMRCAIPWLEVPWVILRSAETIDYTSVEKWRIERNPEACYLERFHPRGEPTTPKRQWDYPRE